VLDVLERRDEERQARAAEEEEEEEGGGKPHEQSDLVVRLGLDALVAVGADHAHLSFGVRLKIGTLTAVVS